MNKQIRVLIIDDEEPARNLLTNFLSDYKNIEIIGECADGFSAVKQINELQPDLIFMDIQMPKLSGLEVLELIEKMPLIVFVTAFDEFAINAFELNAVDYLLKPYSKKRFAEALEKVRQKIELNIIPKEKYQKVKETVDSTKILERIAVKVRTKIEIIAVENIIVFEAQDDYIQIYSDKGKYLKNMTMKYLEEHLDSNIFQRTHRSFIVNINNIERIEKAEKDNFYIIMKNNITAKASKSGYSVLKEKLNL